jgi:2-oxoglutarate dehydrogenase E1 component
LAISYLPEDEQFHKNVRKIFKLREKSFETGQGIDWGTAEALACASLVNDGYHIRISG